MLLVSVAALAWLDVLVRERFGNHSWQLPARVYASPVELYAGRELNREHLFRLLELMRYRRDGSAPVPGTFAVSEAEITLHTRGFDDSDGGERARVLRVTIADDRIVRLADEAGREVPVARLEPLQIGSIHPGHHEDRIFVRLREVPPLLVDMLLAVEDRSFHEHHGISLRGLARAMLANVRAGGLEQGGSTLTQQLVKNFWLTSERSIQRKLIEIPMALLLELHYTKDQILEAYLNEVYLGQDGARAIHGMGLAARYWFGQPLDELAPHQLALLVGMLKGPSYYDPRRRPERALERRNTVLTVAHEQGLLGDRPLAALLARPLDVVPHGSTALYAFPHFIDLVRRQLARDYPPDVLSSAGLQVQSTLDVLAQFAAEAALADFLRERGEVNGAVVVTAPHQGNVLAVVGDKAPRKAGFNRALDASRPIGSLAKPAVVLAALRQPRRYSLATLVADEPVEVEMGRDRVWSPANFDGASRGPMPLLDALVHSRNQAIARLGLDVGVPAVTDALRDLGVRSPIPPWPSIFLGAVNLTPFEVAVMYQTLATGGYRTPLRAITDVLDGAGQPLARYPVRAEPAIDEDVAFLMQWALRRVVTDGTARYAARTLPAELAVAGKTGTSDGYRDAWFAGFSGSHLAVVWLGRDDNAEGVFTGASGSLRVWTDVMRRIPQRTLDLTPPDSVSMVWMNEDGTRRSGPHCPGAREYPLLAASVPAAGDGCGGADEEDRGGVLRWFRGWFR